MTLKTLILNPWMRPHRIASWQKAICLLVDQKIDVLEEYEATVSSPSITLAIPAVARLKKSVTPYKKGVKFSRTNVYTRDNFRCAYCGKKRVPRELTYDHVIPKSRWTGDVGKMSDWENVITACKPCNLRKRNRTPKEAGMPLLFKPYRPKVLPITQPYLLFATDLPEIWLPYLEEEMQQWQRWNAEMKAAG